MAAFVCQDCLTGCAPVQPPLCTVCGRMFAGREGGNHLCQDCIDVSKPFHMARSAGRYGGVLMEVIHACKYRRRQDLARSLGHLLYATFCKFWEDGQIDVVIPVPLNRQRMRKRGFNQTYLMIAGWPAYYRKQRPGDRGMMIDRRSLVRVRKTVPQVGLDSKARRANVKDAFRLVKADAIAGRWVLLVDDVYTTGATAAECSAVLIKGGAKRVDVLTCARA